MHKNILQIKEVTEKEANSLLSLGWKLLTVQKKALFSSDVGWFSVKRYQAGTRLMYVMGRPNGVEPMNDDEIDSCWGVEKYVKRMTSDE